MVNARRRRLHRLRVVVAVALAVAVARLALGVWPTSVGLAVVGLWSGLRARAGLEARSRRSQSAAPDASWLADFTRAIVTDNLASSGNIIPSVSSIYRWQGNIESRGDSGVPYTPVPRAPSSSNA